MTTYAPGARVTLTGKRRRPLGEGVVVSFDDDSDTQIGNVEEFLVVAITRSDDPAIPFGRITLRRSASWLGQPGHLPSEYGWEYRAGARPIHNIRAVVSAGQGP